MTLATQLVIYRTCDLTMPLILETTVSITDLQWRQKLENFEGDGDEKFGVNGGITPSKTDQFLAHLFTAFGQFCYFSIFVFPFLYFPSYFSSSSKFQGERSTSLKFQGTHAPPLPPPVLSYALINRVGILVEMSPFLKILGVTCTSSRPLPPTDQSMSSVSTCVLAISCIMYMYDQFNPTMLQPRK